MRYAIQVLGVRRRMYATPVWLKEFWFSRWMALANVSAQRKTYATLALALEEVDRVGQHRPRTGYVLRVVDVNDEYRA